MARKLASSPFAERHVRVMERTRGFYWRRNAGKRLHGPFASLLEVLEDVDIRSGRRAAAEDDEWAAQDEPVEELVGIANWVDPDTGLLAEEHVPRLDLH